MPFHVLAGMPRSGSTLIANVLNQHPDVYCSSTSALPMLIANTSQLLANAPEVTSDLVNVPDTRERHEELLRAIIWGWHPHERPVVIDKARGWNQLQPTLNKLFPDARLIIPVRDPRDVFASSERGLKDAAVYGGHGTAEERAKMLFAEDSLIGGPVRQIVDMVNRNTPEAYFVPFETLTLDPATQFNAMADFLGLGEFDGWDFDDVKAASTEVDALYRFQFPHIGAGRIEPVESRWRDDIGERMGREIVNAFPVFYEIFGYRTD